MAEVLYSDFEFQSPYYFHFWTNAPWESYEAPIPIAIS